jgi:hypothetical protein
MAVYVLDKHHKPLMPCSEKRARLLLNRRRARVHGLYPIVQGIRSKDCKLVQRANGYHYLKSVSPQHLKKGAALPPTSEEVGLRAVKLR